MKVETAIVLGAVLLSLTYWIPSHYTITTNLQGTAYRLNRWTGEVWACRGKEPEGGAVPGKFFKMCD